MKVSRSPSGHQLDDEPPHDTVATPSDDASIERECNNIPYMSAGSCHGSDDVGSYTTTSGNQSSTVKESRTEASSRYQLAASETKAVRRLKCIVFSCLFLSMVAVALGAYFLTANTEQADFQDQYYQDAHKIMSTMESNLKLTLQATDAFVATITSVAAATNQTWPYVVVPDFAVQAEKIRALAKSMYVTTYYLVESEERKQWEEFTAKTGRAWMNESLGAMEEYEGMDWPIVWNYTAWDVIWEVEEYYKDEEIQGTEGVTYDGPYMPNWQTHPTVALSPLYNWDILSIFKNENVTNPIAAAMDTRKVAITAAYLIPDPDDPNATSVDADFFSDFLPDGEEPMEPVSDLYYPILENAHKHIQILSGDGSNNPYDDRTPVAIFALSIYWRDSIRNILPVGSNGILMVFENPCNPTFTYKFNGPDVIFLGRGDFHDPKYEGLRVQSLLTKLGEFAIQDPQYSGLPINDEYCPMTITLYPSAEMEDAHTSPTPWIFALVAVMVFLFTAATFVLYDFWVERRQKLVMKTAINTTALVSSLFPEVVRDRIMPGNDHLNEETLPKSRLQTFLRDGSHNDNIFDPKNEAGGKQNSKPIAELFPDTTVFFADIAGFTAWSSVREPAHVFMLLESIYGSFDTIARRLGVFKVETIGDSYVAVCGLPEPRKNHALVMAQFASECIVSMKQTTRELELSLGPGTGDLCLRVGLHSGPTIAGVLRGEKARFQLFGDTVNTASRMESTGMANKIQVSQKTAELIVEAGKGHWLVRREDMVNAKGKGMLQTYWLERRKRTESVISSVTDIQASIVQTSESGLDSPGEGIGVAGDQKLVRLIEWNVSVFQELLEEIVTHRQMKQSHGCKKEVLELSVIKCAREEIAEAINMPAYDATALGLVKGDITIPSEVTDQLRSYITGIAALYHSKNGFHNFDHASHVIMSTVKLLQRIATRDVKKKEVHTQKEYFDYTYGISSDPLTKFSIVFAALIHDVDHQGVSNMQLANENDPLAVTYNNKSILEQHSLDLAWSLLMEPEYKALRECIYETQAEYDRFRQLTVNCVMATDIFDKELKSFRDTRWEKAFCNASVNDKSGVSTSSLGKQDWNRKATITIEYIIQASDVSHTMQHWHVYQKWNKALFKEMDAAYHNGRSEKDPSLGWYEGEIWFFDNYVIPLAEKLRECEVFGVACDEFLNFATENRKEWASKGQDIVADLVQDNRRKRMSTHSSADTS